MHELREAQVRRIARRARGLARAVLGSIKSVSDSNKGLVSDAQASYEYRKESLRAAACTEVGTDPLSHRHPGNGRIRKEDGGRIERARMPWYPVHIAYLNPPATLADRVDGRVPLLCLGRRGKLSFSAIRRLGAYVRLHEIRQILCVNLYPTVYAAAVQRMLPRGELFFDVLINVTDFVSVKHRLQMLLYRGLLACARQIVFGCHAQLMKWRRTYRLSSASSIYLYNGVDLDRYCKQALFADRGGLLVEWGLDPNAFVIGSIGRLRREKNYQDLILVVGRLVDQGVHAQAIIVGGGTEQDRLEGMAARHGLRDRIVFAGDLADVRPALLAMDVFVLTSASETFSNAALEAMAMGCPVVLSDVGGAREMVVDGRNGYVYPKGDVDELARILKLIHDRPELRTALGNTGRAMAEERFSFSRMVDDYERLAFPR